MQDFYQNKSYPSKDEKDKLVEDSGLNFDQVNNFFKNKRQRNKKNIEAPKRAKKKTR